jgi:hypothetical protein
MKPLNKHVAGILLAVVEAVLVIGLFTLLGMDLISTKGFVIGFLILGMLTIVAVTAYLYKYPVTIEQADFDPDSVKVPRTIMGTVVEVTAGLFLLAACIIAFRSHKFIELLPFFLLALYALLDAYSPSTIWIAGKLKNARQVPLAVNMNRVLALEMSLLGVMAAFPDGSFPVWPIILISLAILATYAVFRFLIHKAK